MVLPDERLRYTPSKNKKKREREREDLENRS